MTDPDKKREEDAYASVAAYYDAEHSDVIEDISFYAGYAARVGGPVMEMACGSGRILVPLAAEGYQTVGIDRSSIMISRAEQYARDAGVANLTHWVEGDMSKSLPTEWQGRCGLVIIGLSSFMHILTQEDQLATLSRARSALHRDGILIIDLLNPDPHDLIAADGRLIHDKVFRNPKSGRSVHKFVSRRLEPTEQLLHVTIFYDEAEQGEVFQRSIANFTLRYTYRFEMELLLSHCGYNIEAIFGGYELEEYTNASERLIFVAARDS